MIQPQLGLKFKALRLSTASQQHSLSIQYCASFLEKLGTNHSARFVNAPAIAKGETLVNILLLKSHQIMGNCEHIFDCRHYLEGCHAVRSRSTSVSTRPILERYVSLFGFAPSEFLQRLLHGTVHVLDYAIVFWIVRRYVLTISPTNPFRLDCFFFWKASQLFTKLSTFCSVCGHQDRSLKANTFN